MRSKNQSFHHILSIALEPLIQLSKNSTWYFILGAEKQRYMNQLLFDWLPYQANVLFIYWRFSSYFDYIRCIENVIVDAFSHLPHGHDSILEAKLMQPIVYPDYIFKNFSYWAKQ